MHVTGIIAEYNPLHNGHVHHISQARRQLGSDYIVVVMSGDFVQRGEPAIADKYARAEWALLSGADLVIELPTACALASAERFAYGGVRVLRGTGIVNTLCFGSENADIAALERAAAAVNTHSPAFLKLLKDQLALGKSYPRARYDALEACGAPPEVLALLRAPNCILGMEYIRFLKQLAPSIAPHAIERIENNYHDTALTGAVSSATAIREALQSGDDDAMNAMPMYVSARFSMGVPAVTLLQAEPFILYQLRRMSPQDCLHLPDVMEGFENVITRAAQKALSLEELFGAMKSKRYTLARCKRIALSAMLGIDKQLARSVPEEDALYIRVLGFRRQASHLLSAIAKHGDLPLVMRKADAASLPPRAQALLHLDVQAHSLYALLQKQERTAPDFSRQPVII